MHTRYHSVDFAAFLAAGPPNRAQCNHSNALRRDESPLAETSMRRRAEAEGRTWSRKLGKRAECNVEHSKFLPMAYRGLEPHEAVVQSPEASTGSRGRRLCFSGWAAFGNGTLPTDVAPLFFQNVLQLLIVTHFDVFSHFGKFCELTDTYFEDSC